MSEESEETDKDFMDELWDRRERYKESITPP